jgi:hypothetical protein
MAGRITCCAALAALLFSAEASADDDGACADVTCSGHGQCVPVEDCSRWPGCREVPRCICEPMYYSVPGIAKCWPHSCEVHAQCPSERLCIDGVCQNEEDLSVPIKKRLGAGITFMVLSIAPAMGLLATIVGINRPDPNHSAGGMWLPAIFAPGTSWPALHLVGGALLLDAHLKSRKQLGLEGWDVAGWLGLTLHVLSTVSIAALGIYAGMDANYGAYAGAFYPWLINSVVGIVLGGIAVHNSKKAARKMIRGKVARMLILPTLHEGGGGITFAGVF